MRHLIAMISGSLLSFTAFAADESQFTAAAVTAPEAQVLVAERTNYISHSGIKIPPDVGRAIIPCLPIIIFCDPRPQPI